MVKLIYGRAYSGKSARLAALLFELETPGFIYAPRDSLPLPPWGRRLVQARRPLTWATAQWLAIDDLDLPCGPLLCDALSAGLDVFATIYTPAGVAQQAEALLCRITELVGRRVPRTMLEIMRPDA